MRDARRDVASRIDRGYQGSWGPNFLRPRSLFNHHKNTNLGGGCGLRKVGEEHYCPFHPQAQLDIPSCLLQIPRV